MMWRVLFDVFVDVDDGRGWATGGRITQIVSGNCNYYHWWIMNKYYYIIILGGRVLISSSCMYYSISNTVLGWLGLMEMEGRRCV